MKRTYLWVLLGLVSAGLIGCSSPAHRDQQQTQSVSSMEKGHNVQSLQKGSAAATLGKGK